MESSTRIIETNPIEYGKSQLVRNRYDVVLLTIIPETPNDAFERQNRMFTGVVVHPGRTTHPIGEILTQQKIAEYTYYKDLVQLHN